VRLAIVMLFSVWKTSTVKTSLSRLAGEGWGGGLPTTNTPAPAETIPPTPPRSFERADLSSPGKRGEVKGRRCGWRSVMLFSVWK